MKARKFADDGLKARTRLYSWIMQTTKQALALLVVGLVGASAWGQVEASARNTVAAPAGVVPPATSFAAFPDTPEPRSNPARRAPPRNVSDAHPYGDDPSVRLPRRGSNLPSTIKPVHVHGLGGAVSGKHAAEVAFRELDLKTSSGPRPASAPIDSENPYVTGKH